jgi:hypothetical protein
VLFCRHELTPVNGQPNDEGDAATAAAAESPDLRKPESVNEELVVKRILPGVWKGVRNDSANCDHEPEQLYDVWVCAKCGVRVAPPGS